MRRLLLASLLCAIACGGNSAYQDSAARCAAPRSGTDPFTGKLFPDQKGSLNDEKTWLRGFMGDLYLWYQEIPNADAAKFNNITDYFRALKSPNKTPTNRLKDQFSFTLDTAEWKALSQSGVESGYGVTWALVSRTVPRRLVVADTEPNSPASSPPASLSRGVEIIAIDTAQVVDGDKNVLNAGISPSAPGQSHHFVVNDHGTQRQFDMQSAAVTTTPVKYVQLIPNTKIGYLNFTAHIATAEKLLVEAFDSLKLQGATDLVLDLRYNGGGYLALASELAYMIAGPSNTAGAYFEKTIFNDKYPTQDAVTGAPLKPTPFYSQTLGLSGPPGRDLPYLGLQTVYVLTGGNTCSASESVINGLLGAGIKVYLFGNNTCGKPYGFYPQDNCGTTFFAIEFKGINAQGFGDYADGFVPGGTVPPGPAGPPGCQVADDFTHPLGDPAEARLKAALQFKATNGSCPPAPLSRAELTVAAQGDVALIRHPALENRILWSPR